MSALTSQSGIHWTTPFIQSELNFFHTRTELNNENKVILLTNCDFIHYTFGWFSEGLLDKRQHFLFNSIIMTILLFRASAILSRHATFYCVAPQNRVKGFSVKHDGTQLLSVMRDRAQAWCVIFLWNFRDGQNHSKLEAETLKTDSYDTNSLPFFVVPLPLNSSDQFSVMRDSLKKSALCVIGTSPLALCQKG